MNSLMVSAELVVSSYHLVHVQGGGHQQVQGERHGGSEGLAAVGAADPRLAGVGRAAVPDQPVDVGEGLGADLKRVFIINKPLLTTVFLQHSLSNVDTLDVSTFYSIDR